MNAGLTTAGTSMSRDALCLKLSKREKLLLHGMKAILVFIMETIQGLRICQFVNVVICQWRGAYQYANLSIA
jgi:hypothetical protein